MTAVFPMASGVQNAEHLPYASPPGMKVLISTDDQIRVLDGSVKPVPLEDEEGGVCRDAALRGAKSLTLREGFRPFNSKWASELGKFSIGGNQVVLCTLEDIVLYLGKEDFISHFVGCALGTVYLNWALGKIIAFVSWCPSFPRTVILPGRVIHRPFHFFKRVGWCFHQSWIFNMAGEESQAGLGRERR